MIYFSIDAFCIIANFLLVLSCFFTGISRTCAYHILLLTRVESLRLSYGSVLFLIPSSHFSVPLIFMPSCNIVSFSFKYERGRKARVLYRNMLEEKRLEEERRREEERRKEEERRRYVLLKLNFRRSHLLLTLQGVMVFFLQCNVSAIRCIHDECSLDTSGFF